MVPGVDVEVAVGPLVGTLVGAGAAVGIEVV